jgi:hypothetical protein
VSRQGICSAAFYLQYRCVGKDEMPGVLYLCMLPCTQFTSHRKQHSEWFTFKCQLTHPTDGDSKL